MKKKLVRIVSLVLCLVMVSALWASAYAAGYSYPSLSETNYCEFIAPKDITVYRDKNFKNVGTCNPAKTYPEAHIDKGDDCRIYKITTSYILVNYPVGSSRRTGYIKRGELSKNLRVNQPCNVFKSSGKVTTYYYLDKIYYDAYYNYGYTEKNDTIYCCMENRHISGDEMIPIMYTAKSGNRGYKLGFVTGSDYVKIKDGLI